MVVFTWCWAGDGEGGVLSAEILVPLSDSVTDSDHEETSVFNLQDRVVWCYSNTVYPDMDLI